jgi:hypothetical protein
MIEIFRKVTGRLQPAFSHATRPTARGTVLTIILASLMIVDICNGQSDRILTERDIRKWMRENDFYSTDIILSSNDGVHLQETIALLAPIIVCKTQLDYDFTSSDVEDEKLADSLTRLAMYKVFSNKIHLRNVDTDGSISNKLEPGIKKAIFLFKSHAYNSYELDSIDSTIKSRYAIIPYVEWTKTIPNFDPKKPRNEGNGILLSTNVYTWARCHAFIFVIDYLESDVVFCKYESWWSPLFLNPLSE